MAKKGRGSRKSTKSAKGIRASSASTRSKKGKRRSTKGKRRSTKGKRTTKVSPSIASVAPILPPPPPACTELLQPLDPCKYDKDTCCKAEILCQPNHLPGILEEPEPMTVAGSESGSYDSICKLLRAGFICANRLLALTPWGQYIIFREHKEDNKIFFVFDGCTCNVNRFRYMDLKCGTAGFLYFKSLHEVLIYIMDSKWHRLQLKKIDNINIDEMCKDFCKY